MLTNFQNSFNQRPQETCYTDKCSHITWSLMLHYLVKVEDTKMPPILASSTFHNDLENMNWF